MGFYRPEIGNLKTKSIDLILIWSSRSRSHASVEEKALDVRAPNKQLS
jgi:hypothetical protein